MKTVQRIYRTLLNTVVLSMVLTVILTPAVARSASAIAKGYVTEDRGLQPGMVAALSESGSADSPQVKRASQEDGDKIIGVTTTADQELITIASGDQQVYVQITGEVSAFVSNVDGSIKKGDLLTISPITGVLMKSDSGAIATIVGVALEDFVESGAETRSIDTGSGNKEVKVAKIRINLDHKAASNQQTAATDSSLERLGRAVTGRNVGEIQVLAAVVIFLIVLVAEGGIIYGAVSSAITALGRNPMARTIIRTEMVRVIFIAFGVLVLGVAAIYGILWI